MTDDPAAADEYRRWFDRFAVEHAQEYFVDGPQGSWRHELDPRNHPQPASGRASPDVYHAYQAMLLPRLGEVSSFVDGPAAWRPETGLPISGGPSRTV